MAGGDGLIVSVSGVRGVIGAGLTPHAALRFAAALGTWANGAAVVVSRDGRPSGEMLRYAVLAGLTAAGCSVHDLGVAPTPTFGFAVRQLGAAAGIQITASHNPAEWNGLKLFNADGRVFPPDQGRQLQTVLDTNGLQWATWDRVGTVRDCPDARTWHRDRVLQLVHADRIRGRHLRVFLDANGGAGGLLGRELLAALRTRSVFQGCEAEGSFAHEPEPTAENLVDVCPKVAECAADVGFALDPDADRLALIDETGRYLGEELTLALAVRYRLEQERGPVVINLSTSRVTEDVARRFGCECHRAAVGEANVADKMKQVGAVIGGEGNGGVIDPRVGLVRDPFIGMGMILDLMAHTGKKLSELAAELPHYVIVKEKYPVARERLAGVLAALEQRWPDAKADRTDGLRLDWADRWVQVRPSNTEPVVRVIAEALQRDKAEQLCQAVGQVLGT